MATASLKSTARTLLEREEDDHVLEAVIDLLRQRELEALPIPPDHEAAIQRALTEAGHGEGRPWQQVMDELFEKHFPGLVPPYRRVP